MLKQFLTGASVSLLVLFAGSVSAQDASDLQSQPESAQQTAPSSPEAQPQAPEASPEQPQGQPQEQPQEQVSTPVNEEELQQFANAIPQLRELEQSAQQEIDQVIEQSGISPDRFGQLYQAQQAPEAAAESDATPEEQQSFNQAISEIESILQETQSQQVDVIRAEGLEPERFSEILVAIRQDPTLQQQLQEMIQGD